MMHWCFIIGIMTENPAIWTEEESSVKTQMQTKMAVLFCISILAVTLGGCTRHGDMARGIAADVSTTDRRTANKGTGANGERILINALADETIGLSLGQVCHGKLEDYDRIFKCFNRVVTSYEIPREEAQEMYQKLKDSKILDEESMRLTGMVFNDYDGNGERDMLVCLYKDTEDSDGYSDGCLYLFMNEEEPYYIYDDCCCYYHGFLFGDFGEDVDHDGNTEIVFCVQGTGNGGAGDCQKFVLKYKDRQIERMKIPNDFSEGRDDWGLRIQVTRDGEKGEYHVYCPYLDETVVLKAEEEEERDRSGANCRGYYGFFMAYHTDGKFLAGCEYIYAGGIADGLGSAVFLFDWDENGAAYVKDWYVEDWDGKIYMPSAKITAPLFGETQNSEEVRAYEAFLTGNLTAHIDDKIYRDVSYRGISATDSEVMDKAGEGFDIQELINEIANETMQDRDIIYTGNMKCALIDCGNDGKKQLALRADNLSIYSWNDSSDLTMVFDYKNGKVSMVYAADSWARSEEELYQNGYVFGGGSGGAACHYTWEGIIGADGVYRESYKCHQENGSGFYEMTSIHDFWDTASPACFMEYSINDKTIYAYWIWEDEDVTAEDSQLVLDYVRKNEEHLGVEFFTDDKAWEIVEKNRKNLGITEGMDGEENKIDWRVLPSRTSLPQ